MSLLLAVIGTLFLLASLGGIAFGLFMAAHPRTRESGWLFAAWWVPAVAASVGVLLRDPVTLAVGVLCFLVAGAAFTAERAAPQRPSVKRKASARRDEAEVTTREMGTTKKGSRRYRRAAS